MFDHGNRGLAQVLLCQIKNVDYRQDVTILKDSVTSFRVVQEVRIVRIKEDGNWSGVPDSQTQRKEWIFSTVEAAIERCHHCFTIDEAASWDLA
jgi:hypothetical protein